MLAGAEMQNLLRFIYCLIVRTARFAFSLSEFSLQRWGLRSPLVFETEVIVEEIDNIRLKTNTLFGIDNRKHWQKQRTDNGDYLFFFQKGLNLELGLLPFKIKLKPSHAVKDCSVCTRLGALASVASPGQKCHGLPYLNHSWFFKKCISKTRSTINICITLHFLNWTSCKYPHTEERFNVIWMSALGWEESDSTGTCFFLTGRGTQSDYLTFRCLYYRHLYLVKSIPLIWFLLGWKDGVCFVYIFCVCVLIMDSVTWVDGSVLFSLSLNQVEVEGAKFKLLIKAVWKTRATNSESVDCMGLNRKVCFQHLYK